MTADAYRFSNNGYSTTGITLSDGGKSYPVFKTYIEGVGVALAIREKGTSAWHPVTENQTSVSLDKQSANAAFDMRGIYVKTDKGFSGDQSGEGTLPVLRFTHRHTG